MPCTASRVSEFAAFGDQVDLPIVGSRNYGPMRRDAEATIHRREHHVLHGERDA
jgi:hypothetical protein